MQQSQEHEESLSLSEQLPTLTPVAGQKVEPEPRSSQGLLAALENASLKAQQLVTAIAVGAISFLTVVVVIQFSTKSILQPDSTALSQLTKVGLAAFVTAVAVGVIAFALGQITTNQIKRGLDNLQAQFNALADGDLSVRAGVSSPKELAQLAMSFNQMILAVNATMAEAQQKADEQEKAKEELEDKLTQFLNNVEENFDNDPILTDEETTGEEEENEQAFPIAPRRPLLEFIHYMHKNNKLRGDFDLKLFLGASTVEEIQHHIEDLRYREVWLQTLLEETQRELKFITVVSQSPDKN